MRKISLHHKNKTYTGRQYNTLVSDGYDKSNDYKSNNNINILETHGFSSESSMEYVDTLLHCSLFHNTYQLAMCSAKAESAL